MICFAIIKLTLKFSHGAFTGIYTLAMEEYDGRGDHILTDSEMDDSVASDDSDDSAL